MDQPRKPQPATDNSGDRQNIIPDKDVGGYPVKELLQAPAKPPQSKKDEPPEATSNDKVVFLIAVAVFLFLIGITLILIANAVAGFVILLLAALATATAVMAPIK